jgi:hypothetical protein
MRNLAPRNRLVQLSLFEWAESRRAESPPLRLAGYRVSPNLLVSPVWRQS